MLFIHGILMWYIGLGLKSEQFVFDAVRERRNDAVESEHWRDIFD